MVSMACNPSPPKDLNEIAWQRVACTLTVNGKPSSSAVYQSPEGTLFIDFGYGGYMIQPFWGAVRGVPNDQYAVSSGKLKLMCAWPCGLTMRANDEGSMDPHYNDSSNWISFTGFKHESIKVTGNIIEPFEKGREGC